MTDREPNLLARSIFSRGRASLSVLFCVSLAGPLQAQIADSVELVSTPHLTITGELGFTPSGRTGYSVAWVGDVNRDGFTDMVVGAPTYRNAGLVTLYSGKDGAPLWSVRGLFQDYLGQSVAGAGDVNRDGYPDVIAGAPGIGPQSMGAGSAFVYSGKDGAVLWRFDGTRGTSGIFVGDALGFSVAGPGDVNQDGYPDLLVGAPGAGPGFRGFVYLFSGSDGKKIWETGSAQDLKLGGSVEGAGDVNLDGFPDLLVGESPLTFPFVGRAASASVYSGGDFSLLFKLKFLPYEEIGWGPRSLAGIGDVNQDGIPDVIASTSLYSYPFTTSHVVVFSGEDGEELLRLESDKGPLETYRLGGVAGAGDMNLDGVPDFLVTAAQVDQPSSVFVFSGRTGTEILQVRSRDLNERFGSLAGGGDVDGDPFPDFLIGAPGHTTGPGHAFVYVTEVAFVRHGTGVPGSWNNVPAIGTGGELPRLGNGDFKIELTETLARAPCVIAGSLAPAEIPLAGMTLYGDFLTPGVFHAWSLVTDGFPGLTYGRATLPIPIPPDPTLLGLATYWQAFILDPGSPLPLGVSYTQGLEVRVVR